MTAKELAQRLDGHDRGYVVTKAQQDEIKAAGLVVAYGQSDNLLEFDGAIYEEAGAYEGTTVCVKNGALLAPPCDCESWDECSAWDEYTAPAKTITAVWHDDGETQTGTPCWTIKTDIPHETFNIYDDGELFSVGIVFRAEDTWDKLPCGQWISVEERLPEPHFYVIVWDNENAEIVIAAYQETGCWLGDAVFEDTDITHWMPLPEPPKQ